MYGVFSLVVGLSQPSFSPLFWDLLHQVSRSTVWMQEMSRCGVFPPAVGFPQPSVSSLLC